MKIIGRDENNLFIVTVSRDELFQISGVDRYGRESDNFNALLKPGSEVNVSDIYKSTMAVRNVAGSIEYSAKQMMAAIESVEASARSISAAVIPAKTTEKS